MLLPVGDTPNPRGKAYINNLLIAANIAVFVLVTLPLSLQPPDFRNPLLLDYLRVLDAEGIGVDEILQHVTSYDLFVFRYGYRPDDPSVLTLFSAMFLHGSWLHLAGNMLFLWIFGDNVEARLGRSGYILVYFLTGVAATLFFAFFVTDSAVPLVGASGAISGVLGCYFLWFPRNQVKLLFFPFVLVPFLVPARLVLGMYLLVENFLPFLIGAGAGAGVAHGAHIGGFIAGVGIAATMQHRSRREGNQFGKAEAPRGAGQVARSLSRGNIPQGILHFLSLPEAEQRRVATADLLRMGDFLLDRLDNHGALVFYRRIIGERPEDPLLDRAYFGAGKALYRHPRHRIGAYRHFLAAIDVSADPGLIAEARNYLRAIEQGSNA